MERKPTGPDLFAEIMEAEKAGRSWEADPGQRKKSVCRDPAAIVSVLPRLVRRSHGRRLWRRETVTFHVKGRLCVLAGIFTGIFLLVGLLYFFPVYRVVTVIPGEYFEPEEVKALYFRGTPWDLWEAREIIKQGQAAFEDCTTPYDQRKEKHGPLFRYATGLEHGAAKVNYTLQLLSAHLDENNGYVWIKYSKELLDENGGTISGSRSIYYEALWTVQRNPLGEWRVTKVKEAP